MALEWARLTVYPLPDWHELYVIMASEFIVLVDIISEFFKAFKEEGRESYVMDLDIISNRNLYSWNFAFRIMTFMPWGIVGELFDYPNPLRILWLIRTSKITKSLEILGPKNVTRLLNDYHQSRLVKLLEIES